VEELVDGMDAAAVDVGGVGGVIGGYFLLPADSPKKTNAFGMQQEERDFAWLRNERSLVPKITALNGICDRDHLETPPAL
jgi:hypothetical protein